MTCKEARQRIYEKDQQEPIRGELRDHLRECPECDALYRDLNMAEAAAAYQPPEEPETVDLIMAAISGERSPQRRKSSSLVVWILGGLTLLGAGVLVRYSLTFHYLLESHLGNLIDLGVTIAIGAFLVSYLGAFILANADRLGGVSLREHKKRASH
jgi:predicted anti-sigma-YlaC factor YlaD